MSSTVFFVRNLQRSAQAEIEQETKKKKKEKDRNTHITFPPCLFPFAVLVMHQTQSIEEDKQIELSAMGGE